MRGTETVDAYSKRWLGFVKAIKANAPQLNSDIDIVTAVVVRVAAKRMHLRANTYRQYRQAALFGIDATTCLDESKRTMLIAKLYEGAFHLPADRPMATSSHKAKRLSERDWLQLTSALRMSNLASDARLFTFLEANRASGLRPSEWLKARLVINEPRGLAVLVVRNGKSTNGRSHGRFRRLIWQLDDAPEAVRTIATWLQAFREAIGGASEPRQAMMTLLRALQDRLRVVADRLWPKRKRHVTLYSTRHMFAAAAKVAHSPVEVAALMGHAIDRTATEHYARPPRGRDRLPHVELPTAHKRDIARIRETFAFAPPNLPLGPSRSAPTRGLDGRHALIGNGKAASP